MIETDVVCTAVSKKYKAKINRLSK